MPPPSPNKITSTLLFWDYFWLLLRKLFSCHLVMTQRERKYNPLRDSKSPCERTRVHIVVITLCVCFGVFTLASIFTDVSCALYENSPLQRDTFSALWCPVPWPLGRYTRKAQMTGSDPLKKKNSFLCCSSFLLHRNPINSPWIHIPDMSLTNLSLLLI